MPWPAKHGNFLTGGGGHALFVKKATSHERFAAQSGPGQHRCSNPIYDQNCRPKLSSPPMAQKDLVATAENNRRTISIRENKRRDSVHFQKMLPGPMIAENFVRCITLDNGVLQISTIFKNNRGTCFTFENNRKTMFIFENNRRYNVHF